MLDIKTEGHKVNFLVGIVKSQKKKFQRGKSLRLIPSRVTNHLLYLRAYSLNYLKNKY